MDHDQSTYNPNPSQPVAPSPQPSPPPTPVPQFSAAPNTPNEPVHVALAGKTNAVEIVLQWLSYGLWEWSLVSLSILLSSTLTYYFIHSARGSNYTWMAYILAAMLVLLPFAFVIDRIYRKREKPQKHGFAAVVMVINAVVVFLAAIGGLITCVVSLLSLFISASASSGSYIALVSSLVVATLSLLLFLRIMHFPKLQRFNSIFPLIILVIAGAATIMTIAGPFRSEVTLKNDRLIEENLSGLNDSIQSYAAKNNKLPGSLNDLDLSSSYQSDQKLLITKGLVSYRVTSSNTPVITQGSGLNFNVNDYSSEDANYELCANYTKEKKAEYSSASSYNTNYIDTSSHHAGKQCYQQKATLNTSSDIYNNTY